MTSTFRIRVPASSANIGPGYDVLGIGLSLFLDIHVTIDPKAAQDTENDANNCKISYTSNSAGFETVPLQSESNLITRTALYFLRCNGISAFPPGTKITVHNPIPLGRGLGSSGAAVVAGVLLGNEVGQLKFSKARMLDYCLTIENHPDNITCAMMGGFCGTFLRELTPEEKEHAKVLHESNEGDDIPPVLPPPPVDVATHVTYSWNPKIKCVVVIPNFELSTTDSRRVLPETYSPQDVVFNLQRLAVLTTAVTQDPPDASVIYPTMQDRLHQPYREAVIPGLSDILSSLTPSAFPGLLGICLSGSGPTILAPATGNFENIAQEIIARFSDKNIECSWELLELASEGATVEHS